MAQQDALIVQLKEDLQEARVDKVREFGNREIRKPEIINVWPEQSDVKYLEISNKKKCLQFFVYKLKIGLKKTW